MKDMHGIFNHFDRPPEPPPVAFLSAVRARRRRRRAAQAGALLVVTTTLSTATLIMLRQPSSPPSIPGPFAAAAVPTPQALPVDSLVLAHSGAIAEPPPVEFNGGPATLGMAYRPPDLERWMRQ